MAQKHILIVCGEASGDLNAAALTRALRQLDPDLSISGVGGPLLRNAGATIIRDIKELSVMGLVDVLRKLPIFFALKKQLLEFIKTGRPDAVVLIDFSGFNLRFAKAINKSIPVIYYISPQLWASRAGRIQTVKRFISRMIVIFKFEQEFYRQHGIAADFVGHPLLDIVKPDADKENFLGGLGLSAANETIALLPGSREQEIRLILPVMLEAGKLIGRERKNLQFILAKSPYVNAGIYDEIIKKYGLDIKSIAGKTHDCANAADFCLIASGTATLESAILHKPFVLVYKMNPLNYALYRPQVKLPYIGLVNIVAGRRIIPEFIQFNATPEKIAAEVTTLLNNPAQLEQMKTGLAAVASSLGEPGAASRAANIILNTLQ